MNKKLLEFIPLIIFFVSGIFMLFKAPISPWVIVTSGSCLAMLYFYLAFWLYSGYSISMINRIVSGLVFSLNIEAISFCFLKWQFWQFFSLVSLVGLVLMVTICLVNYKKADHKQLLYRSIFFFVMLLLAYCYRTFFGLILSNNFTFYHAHTPTKTLTLPLQKIHIP